MGLREAFRAGLARQLSRPEGFRGRIVARGLNRGNSTAIAAAVEATGLRPGQVGADIGFGGGLGLQLLLDRVGPDGRVHGVELSDTMLAAARRRHEAELAAGRLSLSKGTLGGLPLEAGQVDGLITLNTLYFVDELDTAFAEIARVLRPAGRAVVGVGDPESMARDAVVSTPVFRLRPVADLVAGLEAAGLDVREQQLDDHRGFRLLIASRKPIEDAE
ncbi:arsenite methyltransferase [Marmoricola sp. URHA0025 HA25]